MASSSQIKGITIKIEGDTSPLAKDLASVNKDINQTSRALKDVEAALKLDPSNVELLEQKQQLLNKQIEQTNEKLELERQAGEDAKRALEIGSISQEEYATLQAEIAKTENSLNELQGTAEGAGDSLEETGEAAEDAGDAADSSSESFVEWGQIISGAAEAAAIAIAAVTTAVAATATALGDATLKTAGLADEILTMSTVTGLSTETLQAMNYASELLDTSTETITGSMARLTRSMGNAQEGSASAVEAFESLGIAVTNQDGSLRSTEDVFWDIIDTLGSMDNEAERDAAAMELLGRSARDLNPLIEAGSGAFEELRQEAIETGYVMSDDTLEAFGALDDNMQRLSNGATAARNAIGGILLPILTDLSSEGVSLLNEFTTAILDTNGDVSQLGAVIDEMVPRVIEIIDSYLPMLLELGGSIIGSVASSLLDNMGLILTSAGELVLTIGQGIIDHLGDLAPVISDLLIQTANFIVSNLNTILEAAIQIIVTVAQGIAQAAPELIPAIVDAVLLMAQTLLGPDCLPALILAAQELFFGILEGLANVTPDILVGLSDLVASILESFGELGPQLVSNALEWGMDFIYSLVQGITNAIPSLISGVQSVASTIADYLHFSVPDKGPLADFDESGGDMIREFIASMNGEDADLQRALIQQGDLIYSGMTSDYSGQLAGISSQLGNLRPSGNGMPRVLNVYMGTGLVGSVVIDAMNTEYYLSGGN